MTKKVRLGIIAFVVAVLLFLLAVCAFFAVRASFPRPYRETVGTSGLDETLVYAVIKTESGFSESSVSSAGAVGLMQLLPSTAEFICRKEGLEFLPSELLNGEYNVKVGCLYLHYLLERFQNSETALAAYNAGEGNVSEWLKNSEYSKDGKILCRIPYGETERYIKKVQNFRKIYEFFY